MTAILEDLLDRLEALHADLDTALAALPDEALDWSPGLEMNSAAALAAHTAGAERYWIGTVAGQDPAERDRSAEFEARALTGAALRARLAAALEHSRGVLARLTPEDLVLERSSPRHGRSFTAAWAVLHALEHTALHLGHVQILRQLWEQRQS